MPARNLKWRITLLAIATLPLFFLGEFINHFYDHFTGNITAITQQWHIAALNIIFFIAFLIPLSFRRKASWQEYGLVSAFFVSLFIEMYGLPLSMFIASKYLFAEAVYLPVNAVTFNFLGVEFAMTAGMIYGLGVMLLGMLLIATGWITLYKNREQGLVTKGLYAHSRHPQYLGFIMVTIGWFVGWPTLLTAVFAPILTYKYIQVCKEEEKEVSKKFPEYAAYQKNTPFLI
jgi:protein-S-isoprenylcysteine O-methyltransferase Ste14